MASGDSVVTRVPSVQKPACTRLLYQHDGARPQRARVNTQVFTSHGKIKGFPIEVVVQPAQSPDLNVDDLAFLNSLQSDVSLVAKENIRDLLDAIIKCWHENPLEKMESVWRCLYSSFHGVLESFGDNDYKRQRGFRGSRDTGDRLQQRTVGRRVIKGADKSGLRCDQSWKQGTSRQKCGPMALRVTAILTSFSVITFINVHTHIFEVYTNALDVFIAVSI